MVRRGARESSPSAAVSSPCRLSVSCSREASWCCPAPTSRGCPCSPPLSWTICLTLLPGLLDTIRPLGAPLIFEHGTRQESVHGCGISHAHLHVVPAPGSLTKELILPPAAETADDPYAALTRLRTCPEYLLLIDTDGETAFLPFAAEHSHLFRSQMFRQALVRHFGLGRPWDWRSYTVPEEALIQTLQLF